MTDEDMKAMADAELRVTVPDPVSTGTEPMNAEAVAQMVAALRLPETHISPEESADMLTTLVAQNATLRAEQDEGVRLLENARQIERNVQSVREHEHKRAEAALAELATLLASEAAAMERVKVLEAALADAGSMRDAADRVSQWFCTEARHLEGPRIQGLRMAIVAYDRHMQPNPSLTPTADKE